MYILIRKVTFRGEVTPNQFFGKRMYMYILIPEFRFGLFSRQPPENFVDSCCQGKTRGGDGLGNDSRVLWRITTFLDSRVAEESVLRSVILLLAKRVFVWNTSTAGQATRFTFYCARGAIVSRTRGARVQGWHMRVPSAQYPRMACCASTPDTPCSGYQPPCQGRLYPSRLLRVHRLTDLAVLPGTTGRV